MAIELLLALIALSATTGAFFAILCFWKLKRSSPDVLTREAAAQMLRAETDIVRQSGEDQARGLRQEIGGSLKNFQDAVFTAFNTLRNTINDQVRAFGERLEGGVKAVEQRATGIAQKLDQDLSTMRAEANTNREGLRQIVEQKLDESLLRQTDAAKALREELGSNFQNLGGRLTESLSQMSDQQKERLENNSKTVAELGEKLEKTQQDLRLAVETRLDVIRQESQEKLDKMRQTVDEKLQATLETRLTESFKQVVEHLERVHKGIGEMQNLAANVGNLNNLLTNVKVRGTYGEVQLELLLEQFLARDQYVKNAQVVDGGLQRVEFAIKLPGRGDGQEVLLPIDSKFPRQDYDNLMKASEEGDKERVDAYRAQLESRIRACAKDIKTNYINPPRTTNFAVLFVPTESLYAEILRQPGLHHSMQAQYGVTITGPSTLAAYLNALQMGFTSLAIERRSSEVWDLLAAVMKEFGNYNGVVDRLRGQLTTAARSVDALGTRSRVMVRTLKGIEKKVDNIPDQITAEKRLSLTDEEPVIGVAGKDGIVQIGNWPLPIEPSTGDGTPAVPVILGSTANQIPAVDDGGGSS
jgi:DNA recombination protein RmuC